MPHLFLSYSRKDQPFARQLYEALEGQNRDAWVDWEGIPPTAEWLNEVFAAIEGADAVLFVISPDSVVSPVCLKELAHAVEQNKRLIPILHRESDAPNIPEALAKLNFLFARAQDDFPKAVARLLETVDTDLDWVRGHSRVLVRAKEWEVRRRDGSFLLRGMDLQDAVRWLAEAPLRKSPAPTDLHLEYIDASRVHEAEEVQRLQDLYVKALARQLAAQAELMRQQRAALLPRSILLALEAMRRLPSSEAYQALLSGLILLPKAHAVISDARGRLAYSPGINCAATAPVNPDGAFRVWDPHTGQTAAQFTLGRPITALAMSPDGRFIAAAGSSLSQVGKTSDAVHAVTVWTTDDNREAFSVSHRLSIDAIEFSGDSRYLATASADANAAVWEVPSGSLVARLFHGEGVTALAFSPDGQSLATASHITGRLWNLTSKEETARITHVAAVEAVAFSPDGRYLATASVDRTAAIWDVRDRCEIARVPPGGGQRAMAFERGITGVAFSPDGSRVATASWDRSARIWEIPGGREMVRVMHEDGVTCVAFTPDGRHLITGSWDHTARVWESDTGRERLRVSHEEPVEHLALASHGTQLITCGSARDAQVSDLDSAGILAELRHKEFPDDVHFSPSGESVATTSWYEGAKLWDAQRGHLRPAFVDTEQSTGISFSPDGELIATSSRPGIAIRDAVSCQIVRRLECADSSRVRFSHDGRFLAAVSSAHLHIWNVATSAHIVVPHDQVFEPSFSADGQYVASMGRDNMVRVWDTNTGQRMCEVGYDVAARCSWSATGAHLATARSIGNFRVVITDAATGATVKELPHDRHVSAIQFAPDGRRLATAAGDAYLWNVDDAQQTARLSHDDEVTVLAFSHDGRFLATGSNDHTARVWLADEGREIARLPHPDSVFRLTFSQDGRKLATASWDRVVRIWRWMPEDLIAEACARVRRNFTPEEWRRYFGDEPYRQSCPDASS